MIGLPDALRGAADALVRGVRVNEAVANMSEQYRSGEPTRLRDDTDAAAYIAWRMPATYAAVRAALLATQAALPEFQPRTLLDVGAGPGTAAWAALETFGSIEDVTFVERDVRMVATGRRLARAHPVLDRGSWTVAPHAPADLVVAAYSLTEMDSPDVWTLTSRACVVVEPGTPRGNATVLAARDALIAAGAHVAAPCPHDSECPMVGTPAWCHFSVRLPRTSQHRLAKDASLPYEDEKYSYVAASKAAPARCDERVVGHPRYRKNVVQLPLCTTAGLEQRIVTKRQPTYRRARDVHWGDCF